METNETILTREVVVIDSHKKLGSIKALRVDCDTLAVSHYLVNNERTGKRFKCDMSLLGNVIRIEIDKQLSASINLNRLKVEVD